MSKVTHREIEQLSTIFKCLGDNKESPWFMYGVSMNINKCTPFLEALKAARAITDIEAEYQKARSSLLEEYADKDEAGNAIKTQVSMGQPGMIGFNYKLTATAVFEAANKVLIEEKFPGLEEQSAKKQQDVTELLDTEVEVDFTKIKMSDVPENLISGNDMTLLVPKGILQFDLKRSENIEEVTSGEEK